MNGLTRHFRLAGPVMMWPAFALLRRGPGDPTHRRVGDFHLRATRTPGGAALIKIIANGAQVVLTDQAPISVQSPDLMAGLEAAVTLAFQNAGEVTVRVPVVDGNEAQYATLRPTPTSTPSA